jgi:hypothetical protein
MDTATLQIWHPQIRDSTIALKKKILLCCYPRGVAPVLYIRKLLLDMTNVNFMQEEAHSRSSIIHAKRGSRHNTCTLVAPEQEGRQVHAESARLRQPQPARLRIIPTQITPSG